jgi:hypothetical protein
MLCPTAATGDIGAMNITTVENLKAVIDLLQRKEPLRKA